MKRIFALMAFTLLGSVAVSAQDTTAKKHNSHPTFDSLPAIADSTKHRKWDKNKMPKKDRKNWPDSMGKMQPGSLKKLD